MSAFSLPMDIKEILKILPHRYPFLLVDRIIRCDLENSEIEAIKNLTFNEHFFQGHFPEAPIMPGVLILEALAQAGGVLTYLKSSQENPRIALLMSVNGAKFRAPVKPGDQLRLICKGIHFSARAGKMQTEAYVGDKLVAEAEMGFALVDRDQV